MWKFLLIIFFTSCFEDTRIVKSIDICGKWDVNGVYEITFNSNGKFEISFNDKSTSKTFIGTYLIKDFDQINIIDLKQIKRFDGSLYGIFKFLDPNTIKISKFSHHVKSRPVAFEKNNYHILKRKI